MKKLLIPAALIAMAITVMPSCKKKESDPSRAEQIVGTWKSNEEGEDANNNGSWDASEHTATPANEVVTSTFNSDGTGTITYSGVPMTFTWNLQNSDNDIRMVANLFGMGYDTSVQNIVSINNSEIVLRDMSESPVYYTSFKKQ